MFVRGRRFVIIGQHVGTVSATALHREGGITVDANERLSSTSPTPGQILNRNRSAATGKRDVNLYSMATNQTAILALFRVVTRYAQAVEGIQSV